MTTKLAIRNSMDTAQKIQHALANGLISAAQIYREYVDAGGDPMALRDHVQMNAAMWRMLDGVAMGAIDSRVFLMPMHVQRALLKMPILAQKRYIEKGVDVVSDDGSAIKIELKDMSQYTASIAFCADGVRSIKQQSAYVRRPVKAVAKALAQWDIVGDKIKFHAESTLSRLDLLRILEKMG